MAVPAITVDRVSKRFRLYHEKYTSLKERAIHFGRVPFEEFWALSDIELEIAEGETVGLLGHNGSGKSTLLKCMAGILQPTYGEIAVRGRLAALLELGAGFHPELTGRENVFLNASILGMPKREIEKRFDEIVAFAELEQFIDNQVKHYSSGMYVRLGFAVAVNMDPEILLVDEVLAVGDEAFQRKCLERVRRFQKEGRTIVFVTHAADLVRQICDRAAVLDHGHMVGLGTPGEAVRSFREHLMQGERFEEVEQLGDASDEGEPEANRPPTQEEKRNLKVRLTEVRVEHPGAGERRYLLPGEPLAVRLAYNAVERVDDVVFGLAIHDVDGNLIFGSNTDFLGIEVGILDGPGVVTFETDAVPLLDGAYLLTIGIHSHDEVTVYDWREQRHQFEVMNPHKTAGGVYMGIRASIEKSKKEGAA
ncbi:MAG: lipopolysaccharide transport system ATP-binding protein [Acidimicrobiaceae bacterium]|nr:lipopolysaccharide transport system ATP-binding protein [Acidimicrobiaceae bacterium]